MNYIRNIFITLLFCLPFFAQQAGPITLRVHGEQKPNTFITLYAESSFIDLTNATIEWSVNNEPLNQGRGLIKQDIYLEEAGVPKEIRMRAVTNQGSYEETLVILPGIVDILWEAQTVTPPFYRGKAIPTDRSTLRAVAVPYWDKSVPTSEITFEWSKNPGGVLSKTKDVGYIQTLSSWEGKDLELVVSTTFLNSTLIHKAKILSQPLTPLLYRIHPFSGIDVRQSLQNQKLLNSPTLSILSIPFGLESRDAEKERVLYEWKANGTSLESGVGSRFERITLAKNEKEVTGAISIFVKIQNTINVMQYGQTTLVWNFKE